MTPETLSPSATWDAWTVEQRTEWLATEVMGWYLEHSHYVADVWNWEKCGGVVCAAKDQRPPLQRQAIWSPLSSWDDWRRVEEKVMEDEKLWDDFVYQVVYDQQKYNPSMDKVRRYADTEPTTRAKSLYLAYHAIHDAH